MAGNQKKNMFGGFDVAAQQRKAQQQEIEAVVTGRPAPAAARKRGTGATTITLAISSEDKAMFKAWAATHGTTMSDMLHDWIVQTCKE